MDLDKKGVISWLLEGDPWVQYGARLHLLKQDAGQPDVIEARKAMLEQPFITDLSTELQGWPGLTISSHKSAGQLFHKLAFAASIGLKQGDPGMDEVIDKILANRDPDGPFQLRSIIPVHFGGTGEETWSWALCDAPLILYALVNFGLANDPRVQKGVEYLVSLVRKNGWPCAVSKEVGSFRGPGRKEDPCPFATLIMLRLLASLPNLRDDIAAHQGAESLLTLWQERREKHPYIFYMGTDFCKLKFPLVWYDILHVTSVLAQFPWLAGDPRLEEMREIMRAKADLQGRYTIESAWQVWKAQEFGQKKAPSRALTLQVLRALS
jgi:hypothetical protein